jgi:aerobic carbon-monoxide dehydrogenase large subunit
MVAEHYLEASPLDVQLGQEGPSLVGSPAKRMGWRQVAAYAGKVGVELDVRERYDAPHMTYPYGVHVAEVDVDVDTGRIHIRRYLIAYDVGRAVNPTLVKGQIIGGMVQGLGGALLEELAYDKDGQLLSGTFMDYLLPTSCEAPDVEVIITEDAPSRYNPLGVKGCGEGGTTGVGAALANAVADALDAPPEAFTELPIRPETARVWMRRLSAQQSLDRL